MSVAEVGPVRILVVDDSDIVCDSLAIVLEDAGYCVTTAHGGAEALEAAAKEAPSVVISDVNMPGMSGLELARTLKERMPLVPVILLTEQRDVELVVHAMRDGAFGYVTKGTPDDLLLHEIKAALTQRATLARNQELEAANREYFAGLERLIRQKTAEISRLEQVKSHAEKMASLGMVIAGVAHEINNPLACVLSNVRWIDEAVAAPLAAMRSTAAFGFLPTDLQQEIAELPAVIAETTGSGQRIARTVAQLRQLVHPGASGTSMWAAAVEEVRRLTVHAVGTRDLTFHSDAELQQLAIAQDDLVTVLANLISNAADASAERSRIVVRAFVVSDGHTAEIAVEDQGCGIPAHHLSKVFEPFFTTKPPGQGTGLGLSLVYQLVRRVGGEVDVRSEPGLGTCFTLRLPLGSVLNTTKDPQYNALRSPQPHGIAQVV